MKALLGREFTDDETLSAQLALDLATGAIRDHTRQHLSLVEDDEVTLNGNTSRQLVLPERPVVSVSTVNINGTPIAPVGWQLVRDTIWWGNTLLNVANATDDLGYGWGTISTPIDVTYTHGFDPIPDGIRAVCAYVAFQAFRQPIPITAESIGNYSVAFGKIAQGALELSSFQQQLLNKYRKTWK